MATPTPTKRLGNAEWKNGVLWIRLSRSADPTRKRIDLRDILGNKIATDEAEALEQGKRTADKLSRDAIEKRFTREHRAASKDENVLDWADRWHAWRLERKTVETDETDRSIIRNHIEPVIGHRPMRLVERVEIEAIVERLDKLIAADELHWKSAANAWSVVRAMFRDACNAKDRSLRVRSDNPCDDVEPPERGEKRETTILYPSEYLTLMTAPAIWEASGEGKMRAAMLMRRKSARRWMRLITIAIYLQMRASEIRALRWESVDLEHRVIQIHKATKKRGKGLKDPKKGSKRTFEIPIEAMPLLEAMHAEAKEKQGKEPTGPVTTMPPAEKMATYLRTLLTLAKCTREALHVDDGERKQLTFHDLRATGITWRIMRGDNPFLVQGAAGHKSFSTTEGYIRATNLRGKGVGEPFPPIPEIVLGTSGGVEKTEARGNSPSPAHTRDGDATTDRRPPAVPQLSPNFRNVPNSKTSFATPTGIENEDRGKNRGKTWQRGTTVPQDVQERAISHGGDPVAAALRVGLDVAIDEGRSTDAADLARALAARTRAVSDPKIVQLAGRRR